MRAWQALIVMGALSLGIGLFSLRRAAPPSYSALLTGVVLLFIAWRARRRAIKPSA